MKSQEINNGIKVIDGQINNVLTLMEYLSIVIGKIGSVFNYYRN